MKGSHCPLGGKSYHKKLQRNRHMELKWQQKDFYTIKVMQIHVYTINIFNGRNLLTGIEIYLLSLYLLYIISIQIS